MVKSAFDQPDVRSPAAERRAIQDELAALARRARDAGMPSVALVLDLALIMEGNEQMGEQNHGLSKTDWAAAAKKPLPSGDDPDDAMEDVDECTTEMPPRPRSQ